jgi:hypothetical protein
LQDFVGRPNTAKYVQDGLITGGDNGWRENGPSLRVSPTQAYQKPLALCILTP